MPFVYRLHSNHTLSIDKLSHALQLIINKHPSLRTALIFNSQKQQLMQNIITTNKTHFSFIHNSTYQTDQQLQQILFEEKRNPYLFDLVQGRVFRCHIIYYNQISPDGQLSDKDVLILNFHHALFDFPSMNIFLQDLNQAYVTGQSSLHDDDEENTLRYLDCKYHSFLLLLILLH